MINAKFDKEDWARIINALQTYVIVEEEALKSRNVGDKEWNALVEYETLIRDIQFYIIGQEDKT